MSTRDQADLHYLSHGGFNNHSLNGFLQSTDPATRKRNAELLRQVSPDSNESRCGTRQTAYEQWWYSHRRNYLNQLEGTPSEQQQQQQSPSRSALPYQQKQQQQSPTNNVGVKTPAVPADVAQVSPSRIVYQQQQQQNTAASGNSPAARLALDSSSFGRSVAAATTSAAAAGVASFSVSPSANGLNRSSVSSASRGGSGSQPRSASRTAVPGSSFESLNPSHLYLHTGTALHNHELESLVTHSGETALRKIRASKERSPPRGADPANPYKGLSQYERWYYQERDRVAQFLEAKKEEQEQQRQ
jgi:hypothetical protein